MFDLESEFRRQHVNFVSPSSPIQPQSGGDLWRISNFNSEYKYCESYPRSVVVPATVTDQQLQEASKFRSKGRLPVLTWHHPINGSCIIRCAQPLVGVIGHSSKPDEEILSAASSCNPNRKSFSILDLRPKLNAIGNQISGAGYENSDRYRGAQLHFMSLQNIHQVSASFSKLMELCRDPAFRTSYGASSAAGASAKNLARGPGMQHSASVSGQGRLKGANEAPISATVALPAPPDTDVKDASWWPRVEDTLWLHHISKIISAAVFGAQRLELSGETLVIHCSDGWDRTIQVTSLTQVPDVATFELVSFPADPCLFHSFSWILIIGP